MDEGTTINLSIANSENGDGDFVSFPKPMVFYKYCPFNEFMKSMLTNHRFYCCHQYDLNDMFDCKYALSEAYLNQLFDLSLDRMYESMIELKPEISSWPLKSFKKCMLDLKDESEFRNSIYNMVFVNLGFRVTCFSSEYTNELMWAHYADHHRGVCLEFDFSNDPEVHKFIHQVAYSNNLYTINSQDEVLDAALTKRVAWKHEKEWRIISLFSEYVEFKIGSLKKIYFGANVPLTQINNLREKMISAGYTNVDFKQIELSLNGVRFKYDPKYDLRNKE